MAAWIWRSQVVAWPPFWPKKYAFVYENCDYTWHANGIRATQNVREYILSKFESVLSGNLEEADHCAIVVGSDIELRHSEPGTTKKLRFICLHGAVEDGGIRWWEDKEEFDSHCHSAKLIGFPAVAQDALTVGMPRHPSDIPTPIEFQQVRPQDETGGLYQTAPECMC